MSTRAVPSTTNSITTRSPPPRSPMTIQSGYFTPLTLTMNDYFLRREAASTNYFVRPVTVRSSVSINDNHNKESLKIHENPIGQVQGVH